MPSGCHDRSRRVTQPLCTLSEHHALIFIIKTERPREAYSEQLLEKSMANKKRACGHSVKFKLTNCSFSLFFLDSAPIWQSEAGQNTEPHCQGDAMLTSPLHRAIHLREYFIHHAARAFPAIDP